MEYESFGHRGHFSFQSRIDSLTAAVEHSYVENLERFKVKSASLEVSDYDAKERAVPVALTLSFVDGTSATKGWKQYVDESALSVDRTFLSAYVGATKEEVDGLFAALKGGQSLQAIEPEIWSYLASEYALSSLPNDDGGEWTERDEADVVERFELKAGG